MIPSIHFITQEIEGFSHWQLAEEFCKGGGKLVQLRVKNKSFEETEIIAKKTKEVCDFYQCKLIINDNVFLAKKINAYGVHLGKKDIHPQDARKILGNNFIIGGTCDNFEYLKKIGKNVDYIGLGPFRYTETKQDLSPILGLEGYSKIINLCKEQKINVPIIAIGGILIEDVKDLKQTGVYGIAISGAISKAENKVTKTEAFLKLISE